MKYHRMNEVKTNIKTIENALEQTLLLRGAEKMILEWIQIKKNYLDQ